jgi:hypothetical protein
MNLRPLHVYIIAKQHSDGFPKAYYDFGNLQQIKLVIRELEGESENYNKNLPFEEQLLLFSSLGTCYDKSDPKEKYEKTSHSLRKFCIVIKDFR